MNKTTSPNERLLVDSVEAAQLLGMGTRKLWALTKDGTIPHLRIGRNVRYSISALEQWITSQMQGGCEGEAEPRVQQN